MNMIHEHRDMLIYDASITAYAEHGGDLSRLQVAKRETRPVTVHPDAF